ncbi:DEAD/DEAH box helicase [Rhodococcus antarcticus]|uniref:DEAD/DEAH box helicase n=1 Tax=Rhodococcus antarcticus TaxID=2987751 RepID=A0ABY6NZX7_9NOCA|nr:DEAD/DEAH box helicase [Rhodococcus antarcticus]UZJ24458.1 DEAD/DEAH box helicase [Rhodococcus antarcticus]
MVVSGVTSYGSELLGRLLAGVPRGELPLTHTRELPARQAQVVAWPGWVAPSVRGALVGRGVERPWSHQVAAAEHAHAGRHVVVATGTASGKSLAYQLPVLSALATDPRATALYLSPTKALGADQVRSVAALGLPDVRASVLDGDTPLDERDWVRAHSRWVFTNPDMLHLGVLARHERWAVFLRRLRYVVVDECHSYRGVFGSHVALVLRRLLRICARYGSAPVVVLASATSADPAPAAGRLIGADVVAVTEDGSPHGPRTVALWEPPLLEHVSGENGAPVRRSAGTEAARILADLVVEGARTLAFVRSRRGAELTALGARRLLEEVEPGLGQRVAAYRAGYLAEDRRSLEAALGDGRLLGVATTNALELGVDVAGLDAVVVAGFPGTVASFWQQAGRAGRRGEGSLVVLVARDDPMDTYLVHHPSALLDRPVEASVTDPANPYVLGPHLACTAAEQPVTVAEADALDAVELLDELVAAGVLRRRPRGWYLAAGQRPHADVDLRGTGGLAVAIVEESTGRVLGTVENGSAPSQVHPGAVHLHQGTSYVVDHLDLDDGLALVHAEDPDWSTSARSVTDIGVVRWISRAVHGAVEVALAEVEVSDQVVGYLRKDRTGAVLETVELDMPVQVLRTRAVVYALDPELVARCGVGEAELPGALHAAEHAAIGLLGLVATCDRSDIGGVSTALHPDTGRPTVFVHDGHPGGAGFAERGHAEIVRWLTATRDAIAACECASGCPSCVQSPKCGNGNDPLHKAGAVLVLDAVLGELAG